MVDIIASETGTYDDGEWLVELKGKKILLKPDRVVIGANGFVRVQRVRTGRKTKSEADNRIYALLRRGAATRYAGKRVSIETLYLAARESVPVSLGDDDKSLREYTDTIAAIERGAFAPKPKDSRTCPNCQCYFICDFVQGVST
jgi:DNA helicase II / ATP-dependent DNA helicase PcrA